MHHNTIMKYTIMYTIMFYQLHLLSLLVHLSLRHNLQIQELIAYSLLSSASFRVN